MTMNKNTDDSLSLPNIRSARRRFSLRRFFCRRPSTRFALSLVGGSISERNKNEDGSLQSMTGVSVNTAPVLGHQSSKSADTKSSNDSNYCPSGAQGAGGTSTNGVDGSGMKSSEIIINTGERNLNNDEDDIISLDEISFNQLPERNQKVKNKKSNRIRRILNIIPLNNKNKARKSNLNLNSHNNVESSETRTSAAGRKQPKYSYRLLNNSRYIFIEPYLTAFRNLFRVSANTPIQSADISAVKSTSPNNDDNQETNLAKGKVEKLSDKSSSNNNPCRVNIDQDDINASPVLISKSLERYLDYLNSVEIDKDACNKTPDKVNNHCKANMSKLQPFKEKVSDRLTISASLEKYLDGLKSADDAKNLMKQTLEVNNTSDILAVENDKNEYITEKTVHNEIKSNPSLQYSSFAEDYKESESAPSILNKSISEKDTKRIPSILNKSISEEDTNRIASILNKSISEGNTKRIPSILNKSISEKDTKRIPSILNKSISEKDTKRIPSILNKSISEEKKSMQSSQSILNKSSIEEYTYVISTPSIVNESFKPEIIYNKNTATKSSNKLKNINNRFFNTNHLLVDEFDMVCKQRRIIDDKSKQDVVDKMRKHEIKTVSLSVDPKSKKNKRKNLLSFVDTKNTKLKDKNISPEKKEDQINVVNDKYIKDVDYIKKIVTQPVKIKKFDIYRRSLGYSLKNSPQYRNTFHLDQIGTNSNENEDSNNWRPTMATNKLQNNTNSTVIDHKENNNPGPRIRRRRNRNLEHFRTIDRMLNTTLNTPTSAVECSENILTPLVHGESVTSLLAWVDNQIMINQNSKTDANITTNTTANTAKTIKISTKTSTKTTAKIPSKTTAKTPSKTTAKITKTSIDTNTAAKKTVGDMPSKTTDKISTIANTTSNATANTTIKNANTAANITANTTDNTATITTNTTAANIANNVADEAAIRAMLISSSKNMCSQWTDKNEKYSFPGTSLDSEIRSRKTTRNKQQQAEQAKKKAFRSRVRLLASSNFDLRTYEMQTKVKNSNQDLSTEVECILCYNPQPREDFPNVGTCGHHFCFTCLRRYLEIEISESRVFLTCPQCPAELLPSVVYDLVEDPKLIERYENYLLRRFLVHCNDTRWCPAPDCGYAVIATDCDFCPKIKCQRPNCNTSFCYHCKNTWHPNQTCAMARIERQEIEVDANDASLTELKECPNCKQCIAKLDDGTCNHMSCPVCGMQFCWLCLKEITDLHYLSPSGCTFWGSRPWSKKKKWISQIATFVGGPVGIVLASTIAIPAVIIGTPIYVGRKIYDLKFKSKTKRKVATATGVVSSMVVSPVIAALAVTVGAPLMLGYLYIVIPIGLVRGYGHAKSSSSNKKKVVDVNEVSLFADSSSSLKIKRTNESGDTRRCSSVDSVGPLDTASTKALAGSIYTRDMDSIKYDTISVISQNAEKIRSPLK